MRFDSGPIFRESKRAPIIVVIIFGVSYWRPCPIRVWSRSKKCVSLSLSKSQKSNSNSETPIAKTVEAYKRKKGAHVMCLWIRRLYALWLKKGPSRLWNVPSLIELDFCGVSETFPPDQKNIIRDRYHFSIFSWIISPRFILARPYSSPSQMALVLGKLPVLSVKKTKRERVETRTAPIRC